MVAMMQAMIDLYYENSKQRRDQRGPVMNVLQKYEQETQRIQYRLFLQHGLLKVHDPEMKRTSDSWYEVSSTEEFDVISTSSDEGYEEEISE
ncbi:hypothetical protein ACLB2K_063353 [Fragaria x ananassa]